jgi:catechol 2,3-dioxygenase-like lactoylglutathione lyase family enzyme
MRGDPDRVVSTTGVPGRGQEAIMRIDDVRIGTTDVAAAARFYRDVLELDVDEADGRAVVRVGWSTITLVPGPVREGSNHLAFTIPRNRFADAKAWLASRTELMTWQDGETELRLGEPWMSASAYFLGPDDIILELITRAHLANPSEGPFTGSQLLCVSEVGLSTPDVASAFAGIRRTFGIETFAGESPHFTTAGDQEGLLILVTDGRPWFPTTHLLADATGVQVTLSDVHAGAVRDAGGWMVEAHDADDRA